MRRLEGIQALLERVNPDDPIVANLGGATFELHAAGAREANLYTWGAMGLVSSLGLGIALAQPGKKVFVTDGDGSLLMNLGSLATIARQRPSNLVHIVWDNHQWLETGGQPTHTATGTNLAQIASGAGIPKVKAVSTLEAFEEALDQAIAEDGPWCIVCDVEPIGSAPRPEVAADENMIRFRRLMQFG